MGMFNLKRMGIDTSKLAGPGAGIAPLEAAPVDAAVPPFTPVFEGERDAAAPVENDAEAGTENADAEIAARAAYVGLPVDQYKKMIADREGE